LERATCRACERQTVIGKTDELGNTARKVAMSDPSRPVNRG
jgi:hypothetical protein